MSYNGSGVFNINTAGQPVVTGTVISSSVFNALTADLATGLSTAITKDGQTTVTANIGFNGYKITNLGAGTAATDAARVGQLQAGAATVITVTGTDTYTGTMAPALAGYAAGNMFSFIVPNTNTSSCTLNIDGQGAKSITRDGSTALVAGDLVSGSEVVVIYDGTRFQVLNSNSKTNFNLSGTLTVAGNVTLSGGTTNQVQYLNGSKVLTGSSNLTFDGTTLTANALSVTNGVTFSGGTANGVVYLNGSKVATTGSALTFDGTTFGVNPNVANSTSLLVTGAYTGSGTATMLAFQRAGGAVAGAIRYNDSAGDIEFGTTTSHPLAFIYGGSEQMRLNSTGLGIGTSSPLVKFQVKDGTNYNFWVRQNSSTLQLAAATDAAVLTVPMAFSAGSYSWAVNNGTNALNLDSSGNLGLGVTPSAWDSTYKAIQFPNGTYGGGSFITDNGSPAITANAYNNSGWKYVNSDYATIYQSRSGQHQWYTAPSGTAGNAISFTQAMTLDASGNLGLGTTSASARFHVTTSDSLVALIATSRASGGFTQFSLGASGTVIGYCGSAGQISTTGGTNDFSLRAENNLLFNSGGNTERARIDSSGNLLVGTTSNSPAGTQSQFVNQWSGGSKWGASFDQTVSSATSYTHINFSTNGTTVGHIDANNTATTYATSSDYRLKDNQQPLTGSGAFIDALKPKTWEWKADGSKGVGFIAHEVQEVSPNTVVGEKDAVDEDGKPKYQAMEYGSAEFIANIVAELQSLRARVAQLEGK